MPNKNLTVAVVVIVAALAGLVFWRGQTNEAPKPPAPSEVEEPVTKNIEALAQCLKNQEVVMYGAEWCSHCQNQKKMFGKAFKLVPYVECPDEPQKCLAAGIEGYPTWILPDGQKLIGEQPLEKLAAASACPWP